jgi:hypothetical protein
MTGLLLYFMCLEDTAPTDRLLCFDVADERQSPGDVHRSADPFLRWAMQAVLSITLFSSFDLRAHDERPEFEPTNLR